MTLLSIREQEAVKGACGTIIALVQRWDDERQGSIDARAQEAMNVIILATRDATRDAIARQVRERAEGYKSLTPFTVAHDLATFIAEIPCE